VKKIAGISAGVLLSALLAHFVIDGASRMNVKSSPWSYRGLSQQTVLVVNQAWSRIYGLCSEKDRLSAVRDGRETNCNDESLKEFGHFYADLAKLACPLIGFAIFMIVTGRRPDIQLWKPLAIVVAALALPFSAASGVVCAAIVAAAMMASTEVSFRERIVSSQ
jgi:hypothetical protein